MAINDLKDEQTGILVIEELNMFNRPEIKSIEKETGLKVLDGIDIAISSLPIALNRIYFKLKKDLKNEEALIIGDDEELTKKVIDSICKDIRFITIAGEYNQENVHSIYEYVLQNTGLSIFYSKNASKILTNYSIIINLIDNCNIDFSSFRNEAIIFDLSISKQFSKDINNKCNIIEDFTFKGNSLSIKKKDMFPSLFPSHIYEMLNRFELEELVGLYSCGELYTFEDFADYKIRAKGKL